MCSRYRYDKAKIVNVVVWGIGKKEEFERELMDSIKEYKFEDIFVKGIEDADKWLKNRYGDYMKIPPLKDRVCHDIIVWREIE